MYGLINKAIEVFVTETYGADQWHAVMEHADLGMLRFEAMLPYDPDVTERVIDAMRAVLVRPSSDLLEDLGTFLVTSPALPAFSRLLRFGGDDYIDFLHSLEDMPDRVRLAVADLQLPTLRLTEESNDMFRLQCQGGLPGYGHVILGVLRAMADDYGTLAMLDLMPGPSGTDNITVLVVEDAYSEGNAFELGWVST